MQLDDKRSWYWPAISGGRPMSIVEPDRIIGTMTKDSRKRVAVMLRTYRSCHFVDICEISTWPVLTFRRNGAPPV